MSREKFDDDCHGCRPVLLDATTGQKVPDDDPMMIFVNRVWTETTLAERQAYHRACCLNSRDPTDLLALQNIGRRIQKAASS